MGAASWATSATERIIVPEAPQNRVKKLVPSLGVADLRRSIAFYRDFFGFVLVDAYEDEAGEPVWCWLRSGVSELMLQQLSPEQQIALEPALGQSWVLYLRPADLDEVHRELRRAQVEITDITETTYGARECFATDPDGYELWLSEPESGAGPDDEDDDSDQDVDDDYDVDGTGGPLH